MRVLLKKQMEELHTLLIEMGALCEQVIDRTYKMLAEGDRKAAAQIIERDEIIDQKEQEIEAICLKILLQQQPVARDLRRVSAALKMITDMERIGDQTADIAEIVKTAGFHMPDFDTGLEQMAKATGKMVSDSIDSFVKMDLKTARKVIKEDDIVDQLFLDVRMKLTEAMTAGKEHSDQLLDLFMIAKYFERIGDHAENIAEWVEFSITGKHRPADES